MAKKKAKSSLRPGLARIASIHIVISLILAVQLIIFDAGKLITPDIVLKRWVGVGILAIVSSICWFVARLQEDDKTLQKFVWLLVITDIAFVSWYVYLERGMSSRAVMLYALPILTSAILLRKGAIYLTSLLSAVAYILTTNAYFVLNFNEGYKLELYGEVLTRAAVLIVFASLVWAVVRSKHNY